MQFLSLLVVSLLTAGSHACSRITYNAGSHDNNRVVVGRSMDWLHFPNSSIWAFPAGMQRVGHAGNNSISWTSKYGSVITSMYDLATVDGINTAGLVGNTLYLADGDYGKRNHSRPGLSIGLWAQYFLDNYETVEEVVADLFTPSGAEKFQIATKEVVPEVATLGHLALTDRSGDNVVMEYIEGKLTVHHSSNYTVMTNEPSFDQQIAIQAYWDPISNYSLPGTDRPADRHARLSYYSSTVPDASDEASALAITAGMLYAVSVPLKPANKATPNIAPTFWRTYADSQELVYFYESATDPSRFYMELDNLGLGIGGDVKTMSLTGSWTDRMGNMTGAFVPSAPFPPLDVED
ncbi:hypothetical protein ACLMJK_002915 [Lecanora helva]